VILELQIEKVAHGGIFVARHEGRVVFVEGAIPGETVKAEVYQDAGSYLRAKTTEVLSASEHRVPHFWKAAKEGAGGAEFGHIELSYQRELKAQVLTEAFERFAQQEVIVEVAQMPADADRNGLHYRTRVQLNVDASGLAGPSKIRSNEIVFAKDLPLAVAEIEELGLHIKNWSGVSKLSIAASSTGDLQWMVDKKVSGSDKLIERVAGRTFRLSSGAFWQVHTDAPTALTQSVASMAKVVSFDPAKHNLDLYSGAGLFSATLAQSYSGARFTAVESNKQAVSDGERSTQDLKDLTFVKQDVLEFLKRAKPEFDTVVLDPPRSGAAAKVIAAMVKLNPRNIIYVACDPVALARDVKLLAAAGYQIRGLESFDIFPHTHHFECVVALSRE
jgi:tRNA/tmRNA/rRNA uracil-C5-methylase (TrmA/RlmC/RlmD family)